MEQNALLLAYVNRCKLFIDVIEYDLYKKTPVSTRAEIIAHAHKLHIVRLLSTEMCDDYTDVEDKLPIGPIPGLAGGYLTKEDYTKLLTYESGFTIDDPHPFTEKLPTK